MKRRTFLARLTNGIAAGVLASHLLWDALERHAPRLGPWQEFIESLFRGIADGVGVPYELLVADLPAVGFHPVDVPAPATVCASTELESLLDVTAVREVHERHPYDARVGVGPSESLQDFTAGHPGAGLRAERAEDGVLALTSGCGGTARHGAKRATPPPAGNATPAMMAGQSDRFGHSVRVLLTHFGRGARSPRRNSLQTATCKRGLLWR